MMVVGIILLAATLFLGYDIYSNPPAAPVSAPMGNATTINEALNGMVGNITTSLSSEAAVFVRVIILFLFASVGYKFVSLGISANKAEAPKTKQ